MQRKFKFENEKRHYEVPTLESTFVNVEAGFAYSGDKNASTSDFGIDKGQNDDNLWN